MSAPSSFPYGVVDSDSAGCTLMGVSGGAPSDESLDYVATKQQFQLHTMLTEQRHPKTMDMSQQIQKDAQVGLSQLLSVDDDITEKIASLLADLAALATLQSIQSAMTRALQQRRQIYFYGCGATGRLAKLVESTFWRPFWEVVQASPLWPRISAHVVANVQDSLIGEMTGADRALISSLEGFEDLQLIGELQLADRGIKRGDVIIAVTEGGETSSVIGTVLAGLRQWTSDPASQQATEAEIKSHLFMVYNNPDHLLLPFERSASVINEPRISKLNLTTGPQAITGSTRMQATTSETFVLASALHCAVYTFLRETVGLNDVELQSLGFASVPTLASKLGEFDSVLASVRATVSDLATFTKWEAETYAKDHFTSYFATRGVMTVFIDSTERSPTFRLFALDTTQQLQRKAWIQVLTDAPTIDDAWNVILGRKFRGLAKDPYEARFSNDVPDPWLRACALKSLANGGDEQQHIYDFSSSAENLQRRGGVQPGDLGCLVLMHEELASLRNLASPQSQFLRRFTSSPDTADGTPTRVSILVFAAPSAAATRESILSTLTEQGLPLARINVTIIHNSSIDDPFDIRAAMAMKIAINAHSTGVMSILGKVLGNCMVNVNPGNLKLVGRATFLIQLHVNAAAERAQLPSVSYPLVNAVLYDSMAVIRAQQAKLGSTVPAGAAGGQSAEVALSIVRILTSLADKAPMPTDAALALLAQRGLEGFLLDFAARKN